MSSCLGQGVQGSTAKGHRRTFGVMEKFYILVVVVVTWVYIFVIIQTENLKPVHFIVCIYIYYIYHMYIMCIYIYLYLH